MKIFVCKNLCFLFYSLSLEGVIHILNDLNDLYEIWGVEVGQHFYWQIGGFQVYAQIFITS
jgi:hypothetical protein